MPNRCRPKIVVIGGANTDIAGRSTAPIVERDSNPGHISLSAGGVGRNIAENLARIGAEVALLTAFGDDAGGHELSAGCIARGIDISLSVTATGVPSSVYLAVLNEQGDMAVAVNDMRALDVLTPETVLERVAALDAADIVVLDANLPGETLAAVATRVSSPLMLDPVSAAKAPRATQLLSRLECVKCNAAEARVLLRHSLAEASSAVASALELAAALRAAGVGVAIVTDGTEGIAYASADGVGGIPAPSVHVVNATGAGDAFSAGVAFALGSGHLPKEACELGSALAARALASESTVSPEIGPGIVDTIGRSWEE